MWKRVAAAAIAIVLAGVGILGVIAYANAADERALEDMTTRNVLVVKEIIPEGTRVEDLADSIELQAVPQAFLVEDSVASLDDLTGTILTAELQPGEQLRRGRFSTAEELRATGDRPLPEEAKDLHQVTVPLDRARALGGNVAAGDHVGVFMSFEIDGDSGYVMSSDGAIERAPAQEETKESGGTVSATHLTLHKVLVTRVEGGSVSAPETSSGQQQQPAQQASSDGVQVTLAMEAPDAERVVFAMEFGKVWLSPEPENADELGTGVVILSVPTEGRDVLQ